MKNFQIWAQSEGGEGARHFSISECPKYIYDLQDSFHKCWQVNLIFFFIPRFAAEILNRNRD